MSEQDNQDPVVKTPHYLTLKEAITGAAFVVTCLIAGASWVYGQHQENKHKDAAASDDVARIERVLEKMEQHRREDHAATRDQLNQINKVLMDVAMHSGVRSSAVAAMEGPPAPQPASASGGIFVSPAAAQPIALER